MTNDLSLNLYDNLLTIFADNNSHTLVLRYEMNLSLKAGLMYLTPLETRQELNLLLRSGDKHNVTLKHNKAVTSLCVFFLNMLWKAHTDNLLKKCIK